MDDFAITSVAVKENTLKISFEVTGRWKDYVRATTFFCTYNRNIEGIPDSIAIIPLLGNVLPIAWVHGLNLSVQVVDEAFYTYLPKVFEGYQKMYPGLKLRNSFTAEKVEDNRTDGTCREACFFSGGVDANYTFLRHRDSIGALATVWGADITLDDLTGWKNVEDSVDAVSQKYGVEKFTIRSNFREFLNYESLNRYAYDCNHAWNWWHEFQHGMGLITLMAPLAYSEGLTRIYIASTYTAADIGKVTSASDPSIDNFVRFGSCEIVHDGYESNRQDKVAYLVNYSQDHHDPLDLRVCYTSRGGKNCCVCEKCCRTITAILLEDGNPYDYGFNGKNASSVRIARNMRYRNRAVGGAGQEWDALHTAFREKYTEQTVPREWKWFYRGGADSINNNLVFRALEPWRRIKRKLKSAAKKLRTFCGRRAKA